MTSEPRSPITAPRRKDLARLLARVPLTRLTAVAGDMFQPAQFPADLPWRDTAAVVDRIADMPPGPAGVSPLLAFATRIASELSGTLAEEIDQWVDASGADRAVIHGAAGEGVMPESPAESEISSHNDPQQAFSGGTPDVLTEQSATTRLASGAAPHDGGDPLRIWGGVPLRNPAFTGREDLLLDLGQALDARSKASVLPHALHGMGGVGKTQLATEFAYRYADRYDVVWWIPAEQRSLALQSLHQLGQRLGIPDTADLQQAASLVLETLAAGQLRWLLIYDNALEPEEIAQLMPSGGGHVILTSRNQIWSEIWDPIHVSVFKRQESVELVQRRNADASEDDADRLAARLDDLPLALDQAVSCQLASDISVSEYLVELDRHAAELSETGSARRTLVALVRLAIRRLRVDAPAVAELLEMFAYLGAEPISGGLLRRGREAGVSPALKRALGDRIVWDRVIRDLRRYGLAKVEPDQRIQVHRLFQGVLRENLPEEAARRGRMNVHCLLASINPGYPDDRDNWPIHADLGPHIVPAMLIDSDLTDARQVVLDQIRYLDLSGDLEGSRRLGEDAVEAWSKVEGVPDLGPGGGQTLRAAYFLSIALRHLGFNDRARRLSENVLDRLRQSPDFGPDHEYTVDAVGGLAPNLRVAGLFREALALDQENLERHRRIFGLVDEATVKAHGNLAVNLRMLSDFATAHKIDAEVVRTWQHQVSENDNRLLFAQANLARDLYGLGRYAEALDLLRRILPPFHRQMGTEHPWVLLANRTLAIVLRKVGRYEEALAVASKHDRDSERRYGPRHEHALAAAMTHANTMRVAGDLSDAHARANETADRYLLAFGEGHPLVLASAVNHAIVLRSLGQLDRAREMNERTHARMIDVLGPEHGFTLCAASSLAHDYARASDLGAARRLSAATLEASGRTRGHRHPYTAACVVNAAIDMIEAGAHDEGEIRLNEGVLALGELLGADHPETVAAAAGRRVDTDIEPPPT